MLGFGGLEVSILGVICLFYLFLGYFCIFGGGMYLGKYVRMREYRK